MANKGEDFGLIRPSLMKQLQSILEQYPDDGQILKELIQNAEDAGATEVKFLYDEHSHPTGTLHHPGLAEYQGPALYAYNNALFKKKDWHGIRLLQDSVKEKDPLKVGRFGLGFKSVLHLTDLPSVISGKRLVVIDPHEKYFTIDGDKTSGYGWNLADHKQDLRHMADQTRPYKGLFGCGEQSFRDGFYQGTMFRFPLRRRASKLSSTLYSGQRMKQLFSAFEAHAHTILLFLKTVQKIELCTRKNSEESPVIICQVRLSNSAIAVSKRAEFVQKISGTNVPHVSVTYPLVVETVRYEGGKEIETRTFSWLVNEYYAGAEGSVELQALATDPALSYIPMVGVAMEIRASEQFVSDEAEEDAEMVPPRGQAFCSLPLPVEQKSATGLPVHVNGFFAVGQNRRHLKWPSEGQKVESDKSVQWNHCLLSELVPKSYLELILCAIHNCQPGSQISTDCIYSALPNVEVVDDKWKILLEPFYSLLFQNPVFFTPTGGGQWIRSREGWFDCLHEDPATRSLLLNTLMTGYVNVVTVPRHILHALGIYSGPLLDVIAPDMVRNNFADNPAFYSGLSAEDKNRLLAYILKDEDFRDLSTIALLPLADGEFSVFDARLDPVYIGSDDHPNMLLPGLEDQLLAADVDEMVLKKLRKAADERTTRLRHLTKGDVEKLLRQVIPQNWFYEDVVSWDTKEMSSNKLSLAWLHCLWEYFRKYFPTDLTVFSGLPIMPLNTDDVITLLPLSLPSVTVLKAYFGAELCEDLCTVLRLGGVRVVENQPEYVTSHGAVIGNYLRLPFPEDVIDALYTANKLYSNETLTEKFNSITESSRLALVTLLTKLSQQLTTGEKEFFRSLPLFRCVSNDSSEAKFASLNSVPNATKKPSVLLRHMDVLIDASTEPDTTVATLLGAVFAKDTDLLQGSIFPKLRLSQMTTEETTTSMKHVFENMNSLIRDDPQILVQLKDIRFVQTATGRMEKPGVLFDPDSNILRDIFFDEDVFPTGWYAEPENLVLLRKMGLRKENDITGEDVLRSLIHVEEIHNNNEKEAVQKAVAILKYLTVKNELLLADVNGKLLCQWALDMTWVPVMLDKPTIWPDNLPWYDGPTICKASDVRSSQWGTVVGSVMPVVIETVSQEMADILGWRAAPPCDIIVEQLDKIVTFYTDQEKGKYLGLVTKIYHQLMEAGESMVRAVFAMRNLDAWIWHGDGFASPSSVVVEKTYVDMQPYIYVLPSEMHACRDCSERSKHVDFLIQFGVRRELTVKMQIDVLSNIRDNYAAVTKMSSRTVERDLRLVISILNRLKNDEANLSETVKMNLLIPTMVDENITVRLLPIVDCTYCDVEWLRQGFVNMDFEEEDGVNFIHQDLPVSTAEVLGVPTLMSRMLHAEELEIYSFGQTESLTARLKRLLDDYTDGLAIPKELLQNADDAGATEVKFLYDERKNQDCFQYLLDDGMKECQGPALWVYNNAVFTDADFDNITKLGGATKEIEVGKIGKFGLGFNAVYNLTDVPSFISRNYVVIFDPHMIHLGKAIKDKSKPGIRIDINRNKTLLRRLPDQFKPYQDIFGCNISTDQVESFDGTLFRLPLRTVYQAVRSEISGLAYDKTQTSELLHIMFNNASNLLLFTQNVCRISVHHLREDANPSDAEEIFSISKSPVKVMRELGYKGTSLPVDEDEDTKILVRNSSVLKAASEYMAYLKQGQSRGTSRTIAIADVPRSSLVLKTSVRTSSAASDLFAIDPALKEQHWLVSSCLGQERSLNLAKSSSENLVPIAGVAVALRQQGDGFLPHPLTEKSMRGQVFCYLPLPVFTGLPVHINGHFAIQPNRRYLCEKTEDDKHNAKVDWNEALLEDAVTPAYLQMLLDLTKLKPEKTQVIYYDLWPVTNSSDQNFLKLVDSFYKFASSVANVAVCANDETVVTLKECVFLELSVEDQKIAPLMLKVMKNYFQPTSVVMLPAEILRSFIDTGCQQFLLERKYNLQRFYSDVFFPNIDTFSVDIRDPLIMYALHLNRSELNDLVSNNPCIPVTPDGKILKKPNEIIDPKCPLAQLYLPEDGRLPYGDLMNSVKCLSCLQRLGLQGHVTWFDLVERAEAMRNIYQTQNEAGTKAVRHLLQLIDKQIEFEQNLVKGGKTDMSDMEAAKAKLRDTPFVPKMIKPTNFPLTWAGSQDETVCLLSPAEAYPKSHMYLVSATQPIVYDKFASGPVKSFLGLFDKRPTVEQVLTQLEHAVKVEPSSLKGEQQEQLRRTWRCIYQFLEITCSADSYFADNLSTMMQGRPCLLIENEYLPPEKVALKFSQSCSPYLYGAPKDYTERYAKFLTCVGVREEFEVSDYMNSLQAMHEKHHEKQLVDKHIAVAANLLSHLNLKMRKDGLMYKGVEEKFGTIFVPNAKGILKPSSSLCFNDCQWISSAHHMNFTHPSVTFYTSACLGVKTKREEALSKYSKGIPFGQKEKLTNSLKRVLSSNPFDVDILKEAIQNADDAEATKIHFILDPRKLPDNRVFEDSWKPLQGPALCIYNNRPFSLADIEGIQRLGEGSKEQDPCKTGQYGVGFSSMYHLTDAPSFLTCGPELGETLCVFDPHCHYVPGATPSEPGMQYTDLQDLRLTFPHVFLGYLEEDFSLKNSTMFRFPLRSNEMAMKSEISQKPVTVQNLKNLLTQLRNEVFDILLFTNNLTEINISEIDPETNQLGHTFTAQLTTSNEDRETRVELGKYVKETSLQLRAGEISLADIPRKDTNYVLYLTNNYGSQEKWLITQRVGIAENYEVPESVTGAFKAGNLALLPRGGVACLLERRSYSGPVSSAVQGRVFCFLPMPINTHLPVHINGHFALGHENRRHLWTNSGAISFKQDYNDMLCESVIAPAYVSLLSTLRMHPLECQFDGNVAEVRCDRETLNQSLSLHEIFFPSFNLSGTEWNGLVRAVYSYISKHNTCILPSVKDQCKADGRATSDGVVPTWQVQWLPPNGEGTMKAFFNHLKQVEKPEQAEQKSLLGRVKSLFSSSGSGRSEPEKKSEEEMLRDVLLDCGFKLIDVRPFLIENFEKSEVPIEFMSPESVVTFFKSYTTDMPMCNVGDLPKPLRETPFKTVQGLKLVLMYCYKDQDFVWKLDGMPLMLTEDDMLRAFDCVDPVFCTHHCRLLPECSHLFLKTDLVDSIFKDIDPDKSTVFKAFDVEEFAKLLETKLPAEKFFKINEHLEWSPRLNMVPSTPWMKLLWTFLRSQTEKDISKEDISAQEKSQSVVNKLQSLDDWCLLPARANMKHYLVPLKMGSEVLCLDQAGGKLYEVASILRKFRMPEVDSVAFDTVGSSRNLEVAKCLVTSLDKPKGVLGALHRHTSEQKTAVKLDRHEGGLLLQYFCDQIEVLKTDPEAVNRLRSLPFYSTICGDKIALTDCLVYTLPSHIPTHGIDVWQNRSGMVFLERRDELSALYDFIGCASVPIHEVYCKFIFQHFELFPLEHRLVHLHHVYEKYLKEGTPNKQVSAEQREDLLTSLKELPFIEDENGDLQPASNFYDPENVLFCVMLSQDKFPPPPSDRFRQSDWSQFLALLGLKSEVSEEIYTEFTEDVIRESKFSSSESALTKSKAMVDYLLKSPKHIREKIAETVADVPFIAPVPVSAELTSMYLQHADPGDGKLSYFAFRDSVSRDHEKLVWSKANVLPEWADPTKQRDLSEEDKDEIMNRLHIQKQPKPEFVVSHFLNLCQRLTEMNAAEMDNSSRRIRVETFRTIYNYLQEHAVNNNEIIDSLSSVRCVLVDDARTLVPAAQTVLNMYSTDEIRPYLYKVPLEFGEFQTLLRSLGSADRATPEQYAQVLYSLRQKVDRNLMTPNELKTAFRAVQGLFQSLQESTTQATFTYLYLPSEKGRLVEARKLVYNDTPSYYDRVLKFDIHFLADLKECGVKTHNVEDLFRKLPQKACPVMLSSLVKEAPLESCRISASTDGFAGHLTNRLKSEDFSRAIVRLIRHETHRRGSKVDEEQMYKVLDRLSSINIYGVDRVRTHLLYKDKSVKGSEVDQTCFVERIPNPALDITTYNVFLKNSATANQELLIPLAEVVNSILSGMLRDCVLYLLPILSCGADEIHAKLNHLKVRLDHHQVCVRQSALPAPGTPISPEHAQLLKPGRVGFESGEFIGYKENRDSSLVYAVLNEEVLSAGDNPVYLINLGDNKDSVICYADQIYKFERL